MEHRYGISVIACLLSRVAPFRHKEKQLKQSMANWCDWVGVYYVAATL